MVRPASELSGKRHHGQDGSVGVTQVAGSDSLAERGCAIHLFVTMPKSIEPISIRSKRFYRLQLGTPSRLHAKQLCTNLKTIGRACTVA